MLLLGSHGDVPEKEDFETKKVDNKNVENVKITWIE